MSALSKFSVALLCCVFVNQAWTAERVALLIANQNYKDARLYKPLQDVKLVEGSLKKLGFKVNVVTDADQKQMQRALRDFGDNAKGAEVAFFYYSGHGLQSSGENYLVPLQANIVKDSDIIIEAVPTNGLLRQLEEARPQVAVVVLDACRDNPWLTSKGGKGLGRMDSPTGTLVAFATSPNKTAADEGLYAQYLSQYLLEPNLELRKVFDKVGREISKATEGKQQPRKDDGLYEDVFLNGKANTQVVERVIEKPVERIVERENQQDAEIVYWDSIKNSTNASDYAAYLADYPRGRFASLAKSRQKQYEAKPVQVAQIQTREQPRTGYGVGQSFKDCADCPEMVVVPSGSFMMGSEGRESDEKPVHEVAINYSFAVGKYEVTFAEWDACVKAKGCKHKPSDEDWGRGTRPVINVSWEDAQSYVRWLSKKTGQKYRLLSESEWEYVARAGSSTKYSWGNDIGNNKANCQGCGSQWDNKQTAPVGSFAPNAFGLYDVHGNVWEWVEDCWHGSYEGAPTNGSAWLNSCTGEYRVLRGGSWFNVPINSRSAIRYRNTPAFRFNSVGFRVSRSL